VKLEGANVQGGNVLRHPTIKPDLREVDIVSKNGKVFIPTDAYITLGIFKTEAISKGNFICLEGEFPPIRFGELMPGSISPGRCTAVVDDAELFCQSVIYWRKGDPRLKLLHIVEGTKEQARRSKIMDLSKTGK